jgi:methyltransferase (TIGR00027 family)
MTDTRKAEPDSTAVRTALWRALHVLVDQPPHVFVDDVGLHLADPDAQWRDRPDMDVTATRPFRASIVGRARFIEDLVEERSRQGVEQYVILGSGLDTFAQRRPEIASRLNVFEVDQPAHQEWKRRRLIQLGFGIPEWLKLVSVDFEAGESWQERIKGAGFNPMEPAVVVATGVTMYLSVEANMVALQEASTLASGSTFATTFILPLELADPEVRPGLERAAEGASASGTPFISYFTPEQMISMARHAAFREVMHVPATALAERYFAGRSDGLRPPNNAEELLVATT